VCVELHPTMYLVYSVETMIEVGLAAGLEIIKPLCYNTINIFRITIKMRKSTRSILQGLSDLGLNRDTELVIESRGSNLIQSAINLLDMIRETYDVETAAELERRFINSIKASDPTKFKRGIKRIQEGKEQ